MSAQIQSQGAALTGSRTHFSAHMELAAGVNVSVHAPTLADLQAVVAKLQGSPAANDAPAAKVQVPAPSPAPTPQPTTGNAPASTATPASAPPAAGGSEASGAGEEKRPTYDDVKARVLSLAKISRDTAAGALKQFGVDNANKLKLEQYPAFIAHADKLLQQQGVAA